MPSSQPFAALSMPFKESKKVFEATALEDGSEYDGTQTGKSSLQNLQTLQIAYNELLKENEKLRRDLDH